MFYHHPHKFEIIVVHSLLNFRTIRGNNCNFITALMFIKMLVVSQPFHNIYSNVNIPETQILDHILKCLITIFMHCNQ